MALGPQLGEGTDELVLPGQDGVEWVVERVVERIVAYLVFELGDEVKEELRLNELVLG